MRRSWGAFAALVLCLGLLPLSVSAGSSQYFPQTGQTSSNAFYDFWQAHGQAAILGLPISPVYRARDGLLTQFYERAVLEWHGDSAPANRVQLYRIGAAYLSTLVSARTKENQSAAVSAVPPRSCATNDNCETFAQTHHTVLGAFRDFWYANGGLGAFGYPLTEEYRGCKNDALDVNECGPTFATQIFERAAFEWHPEVPGGRVLLRRIGVAIFDSVDGKDDILDSDETVPDYDGSVPLVAAPPPPNQPINTSPPPAAPPASQPSPVPAPQTNGVRFTAVQGGPPGGTASATVQTSPGASCSINYYTPAGTDVSAQGLDNKTANASGVVSWSWKIGTATNPGTGSVTVSCNGITNTVGIPIG